jgi:hypothetical protein
MPAQSVRQAYPAVVPSALARRMYVAVPDQIKLRALTWQRPTAGHLAGDCGATTAVFLPRRSIRLFQAIQYDCQRQSDAGLRRPVQASKYVT